MARVKTGIYDFGSVVMLVKHKLYNGNIIIDGFMPDSEIVVERDDDRWTRNGSGDGKAATLVRNPDESGSITFSLNQSSDALDKMNAICQYSDTNKSLNILFQVTVADKSSRTVFFAEDCIASPPTSVSFGKEESGREFKILCGDLQTQLGGSSLIPQDTLNILAAFGITVDETWTVQG